MKNVLSTILSRFSFFVYFGLFLAISFTAFHSYLLFHSLVELTSILIAFSVFILAWYTRRFSQNNYLSFLGIAFLFIGIVDTLHTLSYKGMGVFNNDGANLPTQLWLAGRSIEAAAFLIAPLILNRVKKLQKDLWMRRVFIAFAFVTSALLVSIYYGIFPTAYIEDSGLTPFKIVSEYIVSLALAFSIYLVYSKKELFGKNTYKKILLALVFAIISEILFTLYVGVYGAFNVFGHFFKTISFLLIFSALVKSALEEPYSNLFSDLDKNRKKITELNKAIEMLNKTSRHDLYNTFTAIQLNLALYNRGNQKQKRLNSVMAQAKKGQALIEKTKQLEGAFKTGAKLKVYSITGILKKVIQNYPNTKFNLKGKGTVFADEALYFVFDNIIANAKTHGQADSITINVKNSQQFVSVMVIDNGKGIPKAIINNLFQEGFTYGKSGNSGIGLYIVKKTIERYGGKVTAKAHKPSGAVFSIELPSAQ